MLTTNQPSQTNGISIPKFLQVNANISAAMFLICGITQLTLSTVVISRSAKHGSHSSVVPIIDIVMSCVAILIGISCLIGIQKKKIFASAFLGVASLIYCLVYLCYVILIFKESWFYFYMQPTSAGVCALFGFLFMIYSFIVNIVYLNHGSNKGLVDEFLMKH